MNHAAPHIPELAELVSRNPANDQGRQLGFARFLSMSQFSSNESTDQQPADSGPDQTDDILQLEKLSRTLDQFQLREWFFSAGKDSRAVLAFLGRSENRRTLAALLSKDKQAEATGELLRRFQSLPAGKHSMFVRYMESLEKDDVLGPLLSSKSPWPVLNQLLRKLLAHNLKPTTPAGLIVKGLADADEDEMEGVADVLLALAKKNSWPAVHQLHRKLLTYNLKPAAAAGRIVEGLTNADDATLETLAKFLREYPKRSDGDNFHFVPAHVGTTAPYTDDLRENQPFASLAKPTAELPGVMLGYDRLYNLYQFLIQVMETSSGEKLNIVEAGVYRGKTSEFLCRVLSLNPSSVKSYLAIDTFEGHDLMDLPGGQEGVHKEGSFSDTSEEAVSALLAPYPFATVRKGRIQDVAPSLTEREYHFLHLDMDLYGPTAWALEFFMPKMSPDSVIVIDDYGKTSCPGIRQSVEEFLQKHRGTFLRFDTQTAQCVLIRRQTAKQVF